MMILGYAGGPNINTRVIIIECERQKGKNQRKGCMEKIRADAAGLEGGGTWS